MSGHEKAYTLAYTDMSRRGWRTGSLFQRCESRYGCPPLVDGVRPEHQCSARWFGVIEAGANPDGSRRRATVSGKSKTVVQRRLRDKLREVEQLGGTAATMKATTVAKYAAEWLEHIETTVSPSAYSTDKAAMKAVVATIGPTRLRDLTVKDVRAVAKSLRAKGRSSSTALRYHGALMRMLKAATLDGHPVPPNVLLAENPTAAVNDRAALKSDQYRAALVAIAGRGDGSRWAVQFLCGLRQREALGLTWDYVDLDNATITVAWQVKGLKYRETGNPAAGFVVPDGYEARHLIGAQHLVRPKSRKGWRVVPLVPWAVNSLRAWREVAPDNTHNLVWPGRATREGTWPRNPASDIDEWEAIQAAIGIEHPSGRPFGTHEIRHTTATLLMELRVPESVRMAIMGHASIEATQIYETVDQALTRDALERVSDVLGLPAPPPSGDDA
jgi:integrase